MKEGIITKGIAGFYYVLTDEGMIESKARGVFREEKLKPLIGDKVLIRISEEDNTGYIEKILDRKTELIRPTVSNVTQAIVVVSIREPNLNTWLLDKFILMASYHGLNVVICINKADLNNEEALKIKNIYEEAGYEVIYTSIKDKLGIDSLYEKLENHISVFAGPSGVGKSSLLNLISGDLDLEVGDISEKTKRGKHTTRHVELFPINDHSFVLDTPGFSSLSLDFLDSEIEVRDYFKEIRKYGADCKFNTCIHKNEPGCKVKEMVEEGKICRSRYENYLSFIDEVKNIRRY